MATNALQELWSEETSTPASTPDYTTHPKWVDDAKWADPIRERAVLKRAIALLADRVEAIDADLKAELFARNPGAEHATAAMDAPAKISTSAGCATLEVGTRNYAAKAAHVTVTRTLKTSSSPSPEGVAAATLGVLASLIEKGK